MNMVIEEVLKCYLFDEHLTKANDKTAIGPREDNRMPALKTAVCFVIASSSAIRGAVSLEGKTKNNKLTSLPWVLTLAKNVTRV